MEIVMDSPYVSWIAQRIAQRQRESDILRVCASIDELSNQVVVDVTLAGGEAKTDPT